MNVTCTGCPAKYSVPDDKVRGKKVRITCKHCGTNIVVDGSTLGAAQSILPAVDAATAAAPAPAPAAFADTTRNVAASVAAAPKAPAVDMPAPAAAKPVAVETLAAAKPAAVEMPTPAAAKPAAVEASWLVGFSDERQEPHTTSGVVDLYATGKIDDEALVWKDGMADWLSPFDVPELAAALKQRGIARRVPSFALRAGDDEPTVVRRSPLEDEGVVSSAPSEIIKPAAAFAPLTPATATPLSPAMGAPRQSSPEIKPAASALRQSSPEIKPAASALRQSSPEIKPTGAPKPVAARRTEKRAEVDLFGRVAEAGSEADVSLDFGVADEPAHKMTGARNESSVLFSLDALTKLDSKASGQKKSQDREQEKQAAAALFGDSAPDSLMNLGGGGFTALAAPDFTKPVAPEPVPVRPSDPVEVPNAAPAKKKGSAGLVIGALIGAAAAAGLAFGLLSKKPIADKPIESATADSKTVAPSAPVATATETAAPSGVPEVASAASSASAAAPSASAAPATSAKPVVTAVAGAAPGTPTALNKPVEAKKPDAAAAPAAVGADFDKGAAIAALSAAAASAASCKKPDGPTGGGKASVTFAPSGRATNSTVSGALAGTDVGGCVARVFRSAKVPPFAGDPVTVSKSFVVE